MSLYVSISLRVVLSTFIGKMTNAIIKEVHTSQGCSLDNKILKKWQRAEHRNTIYHTIKLKEAGSKKQKTNKKNKQTNKKEQQKTCVESSSVTTASPRKKQAQRMVCPLINCVLIEVIISNVTTFSYHLPKTWIHLRDSFVVMTSNVNFDARPSFCNCFVCDQASTQQKYYKNGSLCKFMFELISRKQFYENCSCFCKW